MKKILYIILATAWVLLSNAYIVTPLFVENEKKFELLNQGSFGYNILIKNLYVMGKSMLHFDITDLMTIANEIKNCKDREDENCSG